MFGRYSYVPLTDKSKISINEGTNLFIQTHNLNKLMLQLTCSGVKLMETLTVTCEETARHCEEKMLALYVSANHRYIE